MTLFEKYELLCVVIVSFTGLMFLTLMLFVLTGTAVEKWISLAKLRPYVIKAMAMKKQERGRHDK